MTPSVSIAIITLDRHAQLEQTLDALLGIDLQLVSEVVVIDQTEHPFEIEPWRARFPVPVRFTHLQQRGLGPARNEALRHTEAEIVLFIDDDVVPDHELANEHLRTYADHPMAVGVAGHERLPTARGVARLRKWIRRILIELHRPYFRASEHYRRFLDPRGYPVAVITRTGLFLCEFASPDACRVNTVRGCNMSFRRKALLAIGGFDEDFVGPRRDESDVSLSLLAHSPDDELWFNPRAKLLHLMTPTGGCRSDGTRERCAKLLRCELLFARKHVTRLGYLLCQARLTVSQFVTLVRYPSLLRILLEPGVSK